MNLEFKLKRGLFRIYSDSKPPFDFLSVKQIHSGIVIDDSQLKNSSEIISADGISGHSPIPQCILTADCLPIVILGKHGHASIHAGWMGVKEKIVLHENVKAIAPYYAFIGPHICKNCYEVKEEFRGHFPNSKSFNNVNDKLTFDLFNEIKFQLQENYLGIEIEHCELCTLEDQRLNSFRRNKTEKRNYNIYFPHGALE